MSEKNLDLFGLNACDTCRKARKALAGAGWTVTFHDVRDSLLQASVIAEFLEALGPDLVNRRSTTWRGLDEATRATAPLDLLAAHPSLMKRPVIRANGGLHLGWGPQVQAQLIG